MAFHDYNLSSTLPIFCKAYVQHAGDEEFSKNSSRFFVVDFKKLRINALIVKLTTRMDSAFIL